MTDETGMHEPRRRRRLPRVSLRLLLVAVTLCSIWFARVASTTKRQKDAVAVISQHGGRVIYSVEVDSLDTMSSIRSRLLMAAVKHVDLDLILPVTEVRSRYLEAPSLQRGAKYAPSSIVDALPDLPSIQTLHLTHTEIRNVDLASLSHLADLRRLDLSMTRLHEAELSSIESLDLVHLDLSRTRVDDEGLKSLAKMNNLETLNLTRTKVTGHGLRYIQSLPGLKTLRIERSLVSSDDYEQFKQLRPDVKVKWSTLSL